MGLFLSFPAFLLSFQRLSDGRTVLPRIQASQHSGTAVRIRQNLNPALGKLLPSIPIPLPFFQRPPYPAGLSEGGEGWRGEGGFSLKTQRDEKFNACRLGFHSIYGGSG